VKVAKQKNPGLREAAFEKPFQPCYSNFKTVEPVKNRIIFSCISILFSFTAHDNIALSGIRGSS
jgi:hypothetical protein